MDAKSRIRQALKRLYGEGDANAAQIFKGYHSSTMRTGWHVQRFGRSDAWYLGKSAQAAITMIEAEIDLQEPRPQEWPPIS